MTIVLVDNANIGRAKIGRRNRFVGPFALEIRDGARIGSQNDALRGDWTGRARSSSTSAASGIADWARTA